MITDMKKILAIVLFLCGGVAVVNAQSSTRLKNGRYRKATDDSRITGWVWNHRPQGKWISEQRQTDTAGKQTWVLSEVRHFRKGKQHGLYTSFTSNGDTISVTMYRNGVPYGESRTYNPFTGKLSSVEHYDGEGKLTGLNWYYNDSGVLYNVKQVDAAGITRTWQLFPDGTVHRYSIGQCGEEVVYVYAAPLPGTTVRDTLPVEISTWKNGQRHGTETKYVNGVKISEMRLREGKIDGPFRSWTNGVLVRETEYRDSRRIGAERHWTNSGKLIAENHFLNETPDGLKTVFDTTTGTAVLKEWYEAGFLDSVIRFTPDGKVIYRAGNYDSLHIRFTYTTFHTNGTVATTGSKVRSEEWGQQESWYESGVRRSSVTYIHGKPNGSVDCWNEQGVHVFHSKPEMGFDTVPELVWNDNAQPLRYGTKAYDVQREKYQPYDVVLYSDTVFFAHAVHIITDVAYTIDWQMRSSTNIYLEPGDTIGSNQRVPPKFATGFDAQELYFRMQLHYPQMELEQGKSGTAYITFVVEKDGRISEINIAKKVAYAPGLGLEAQRAVRAMPSCIPATKNGKPMRSLCVMKFVWELK